MAGKKVETSQAAQLKKLVKQVFMAVIVGVVLLILSVVSSMLLSSVQKSQLTITMALNQYRLGSKALTSAVQSYAVDGGQQYYDAYIKELNEDKNRDKAIAILKQHDITDEEWAVMDKIASLSDGLVPLEEEAMASVKKGDLQTAQACVFGAEYEETVQQINQLTDDSINAIQERLAGKQSMMMIIIA